MYPTYNNIGRYSALPSPPTKRTNRLVDSEFLSVNIETFFTEYTYIKD